MIRPDSAFLKAIPAGLPFSAAYDMVLLREYWQRAGRSARTILPLDFVGDIHTRRKDFRCRWTGHFPIGGRLCLSICLPLMRAFDETWAILFDAIYDSPDQVYKKLGRKTKSGCGDRGMVGLSNEQVGLWKRNSRAFQ